MISWLRGRRSPKLFWIGVVLLVAGQGPLLSVIVMAELGLLADPDPNPIGFGLLSFVSIWPAIVCIVLGIRQRSC